MENTTTHRFFNNGGAALACISTVLEDAEKIRIATAYFELSGYQKLVNILAGKQIHLLVGREEGGRDNVSDVLNEFEQELSSGDMRQRTIAARQMLDALQSGYLSISVSDKTNDQPVALDARYLYHHAKLYIADENCAVVTSANFSGHGLVTSREAGITISQPDDVLYFIERFDLYFKKAQSITQELIDKLTAWLKAYLPFEIYARSLLELYGLPEETTNSSLPELATYQRSVVSSVLASLMEHNGAFLIASTGLGKTVIAAHTVAYLRMQDEIDNVIVVCPAGLKDMWRRFMHSARAASEEYSYNTLSGQDRRHDSNIRYLENNLREVDERTLIILDESHHFRNEEGEKGEIKIRNRRIQEAVQDRKARVLLMTATPYSRNLDDVNNQLHLLPIPSRDKKTELGIKYRPKRWNIGELKELSDLAVSTVLTTPDVVEHFGQKDEHDQYYVTFSKEIKRYFPEKINLQTIRYENQLDPYLVALLTKDLLYKKRVDEKTKNNSQPMLIDEHDIKNITANYRGRRDPLFEALVLHQFCSSSSRVLEFLKKILNQDFEFEFENYSELRAYVQSIQKSINKMANPKHDKKLHELRDIVINGGNKKVTVFCHYIETAKRLTEGLKKLLPGVRVETTAEKSGSELEQIIHRFAPIANDVPEEERSSRDEIRVLIATGAMSEGYNLQDSSVLVNYDLPWTVLQLAQRMGRLLRPWHEPRQVYIYNFIPSTLDNKDLNHATNWRNRLQKRGEEHRSFAQIPVLIQKESENATTVEYEMTALAHELYVRGDESLNLDQVLDFIHNADALTTSTFYKDLANITNQSELLHLPAGIRSARVCPGKKRLFVLFRNGYKKVSAGIFDARGNLTKDGDRREEALRVIRCDPDEPVAPVNLYPDDNTFDEWVENARQSWAKYTDTQPNKIQIICAMALIPN